MRFVVAIDPTDFRTDLHGQRGGFKRKILNDDLVFLLFSRALAVHSQNDAGHDQCECEKKIPFSKHTNSAGREPSVNLFPTSAGIRVCDQSDR